MTNMNIKAVIDIDNTTWNFRLDPDPASLQVSGLNSGRGLKMTIYAVNANGKSESATLVGFTLKVAELQLGKDPPLLYNLN